MNKICEYSEIQGEQEEIRENKKVIDSILTSKTKIATEEDMNLIGISAIIEPKIMKRYLANHNEIVQRLQTFEKGSKNGVKSNQVQQKSEIEGSSDLDNSFSEAKMQDQANKYQMIIDGLNHELYERS